MAIIVIGSRVTCGKPMMITILRRSAVLTITGRSRSSIYEDIAAGLFPPPIKIGLRASGWPEHEVEAVTRARIAGRSQTEIRELVSCLLTARREACDVD